MGMGEVAIGKLLESTTVTLILSGLVVFVLGLNGGFPPYIKFETPSKQVVTALGLLLLAGGACHLVWREKQAHKKNDETGQSKLASHQVVKQMRIDGEYHTSDTHSYRISIIPLPRDPQKDNTDVDYYRIGHADWHGVGIFDGECFLTVFQINDKATPAWRRGNWGAHVARWHAKTKSFDVMGIELKEKGNPGILGIELKGQSDSDHLAGKWIREHELE